VDRPTDHQHTSHFSPFYADETTLNHLQPLTHGVTKTGLRTVQEIEAEMRSAAQQQTRELAEHHREELLRQQAQYQQLLRQQQLQHQEEQARQSNLMQRQLQHQGTPSLRMLPASQSPRHLDRQRQLLLLQQRQEMQQQLLLQDLQEKLQMEELERQLRAQQLSQMRQQSPSQFGTSMASLNDIQANQLLQQHQQQRRRSPVVSDLHSSQVPLQQNIAYLPQSVQMQQRLLAELAQAELARELQGGPQAEQEALRSEAVRKIMEAERMEEKRRRKAAKIAHMVQLLPPQRLANCYHLNRQGIMT
jgi:DNA topoisomerase 2-associated protein PAT1